MKVLIIGRITAGSPRSGVTINIAIANGILLRQLDFMTATMLTGWRTEN
jgi:hypothetical protein